MWAGGKTLSSRKCFGETRSETLYHHISAVDINSLSVFAPGGPVWSQSKYSLYWGGAGHRQAFPEFCLESSFHIKRLQHSLLMSLSFCAQHTWRSQNMVVRREVLMAAIPGLSCSLFHPS